MRRGPLTVTQRFRHEAPGRTLTKTRQDRRGQIKLVRVLLTRTWREGLLTDGNPAAKVDNESPIFEHYREGGMSAKSS